MPIESLNLQIIIPKSYEAENYQNTFKNINRNTREIEMILNSREFDNSYKKVNSANNINKNNMTVINNRRERKNNYHHRENENKKNNIIDDDNSIDGVGKNINLKI